MMVFLSANEIKQAQTAYAGLSGAYDTLAVLIDNMGSCAMAVYNEGSRARHRLAYLADKGERHGDTKDKRILLFPELLTALDADAIYAAGYRIAAVHTDAAAGDEGSLLLMAM